MKDDCEVLVEKSPLPPGLLWKTEVVTTDLLPQRVACGDSRQSASFFPVVPAHRSTSAVEATSAFIGNDNCQVSNGERKTTETSQIQEEFAVGTNCEDRLVRDESNLADRKECPLKAENLDTISPTEERDQADNNSLLSGSTALATAQGESSLGMNERTNDTQVRTGCSDVVLDATTSPDWMYQNERGSFSGPYTLQQLSEGLYSGYLPEDLPIHHKDGIHVPTLLKVLVGGENGSFNNGVIPDMVSNSAADDNLCIGGQVASSGPDSKVNRDHVYYPTVVPQYSSAVLQESRNFASPASLPPRGLEASHSVGLFSPPGFGTNFQHVVQMWIDRRWKYPGSNGYLEGPFGLSELSQWFHGGLLYGSLQIFDNYRRLGPISLENLLSHGRNGTLMGLENRAPQICHGFTRPQEHAVVNKPLAWNATTNSFEESANLSFVGQRILSDRTVGCSVQHPPGQTVKQSELPLEQGIARLLSCTSEDSASGGTDTQTGIGHTSNNDKGDAIVRSSEKGTSKPIVSSEQLSNSHQSSEPEDYLSGPPGFCHSRKATSMASKSENCSDCNVSPFWKAFTVPWQKTSSGFGVLSTVTASDPQSTDLQGEKVASPSGKNEIPEMSFPSSSGLSSGVEKLKSCSDQSRGEASSRGSTVLPNGQTNGLKPEELLDLWPSMGSGVTVKDKSGDNGLSSELKVEELLSAKSKVVPQCPLDKAYGAEDDPQSGKRKFSRLSKVKSGRDEVSLNESDTSEPQSGKRKLSKFTEVKSGTDEVILNESDTSDPQTGRRKFSRLTKVKSVRDEVMLNESDTSDPQSGKRKFARLSKVTSGRDEVMLNESDTSDPKISSTPLFFDDMPGSPVGALMDISVLPTTFRSKMRRLIKCGLKQEPHPDTHIGECCSPIPQGDSKELGVALKVGKQKRPSKSKGRPVKHKVNGQLSTRIKKRLNQKQSVNQEVLPKSGKVAIDNPTVAQHKTEVQILVLQQDSVLQKRVELETQQFDGTEALQQEVDPSLPRRLPAPPVRGSEAMRKKKKSKLRKYARPVKRCHFLDNLIEADSVQSRAKALEMIQKRWQVKKGTQSKNWSDDQCNITPAEHSSTQSPLSQFEKCFVRKYKTKALKDARCSDKPASSDQGNVCKLENSSKLKTVKKARSNKHIRDVESVENALERDYVKSGGLKSMSSMLRKSEKGANFKHSMEVKGRECPYVPAFKMKTSLVAGCDSLDENIASGQNVSVGVSEECHEEKKASLVKCKEAKDKVKKVEAGKYGKASSKKSGTAVIQTSRRVPDFVVFDSSAKEIGRNVNSQQPLIAGGHIVHECMASRENGGLAEGEKVKKEKKRKQEKQKGEKDNVKLQKTKLHKSKQARISLSKIGAAIAFQVSRHKPDCVVFDPSLKEMERNSSPQSAPWPTSGKCISTEFSYEKIQPICTPKTRDSQLLKTFTSEEPLMSLPETVCLEQTMSRISSQDSVPSRPRKHLVTGSSQSGLPLLKSDWSCVDPEVKESKVVSAGSEVASICPESNGCARVSVDGWVWRNWARKMQFEGKKRTRSVRSQEQVIDSVPVVSAHILARTLISFTSQKCGSARKDRAARRKLAVAVEGSDVLKLSQLKGRKKRLKFQRSKIHEWGLIALDQIETEDFIIEYVGELIRPRISDLREQQYESMGIGSSYLFRIDDEYVVDATRRGGLARFINHSCEPNCYTKIITAEGQKKVVIYSKRLILAGEELTYDYKFPLEEKKITCCCGSARCRGFMN